MPTTATLDHHDKHLKDFRDELDACTRTAVCGRKFVLVSKLKNWLRSKDEHNVTNFQLQLETAYRDRPEANVPIPPTAFDDSPLCCLLIFCTLHTIGCGSLIHFLKKERKNDGMLPLDLDTLQNVFSRAPVANAEIVAYRFFDTQYRFCPVNFDYQGDYHWPEEDIVVPIYSKSPINTGGTARLWHIDVPEEFIDHALREVAAGSRFNCGSDEDPEWRYEFALKTYRRGAQKVYENESDVFNQLKGQKGIVKWLACFTKAEPHHGPLKQPHVADLEPQQNATYNILLEFGEVDLNGYFYRRLIPVIPEEIEEFWRNVFQIAYAVEEIHDFKDQKTNAGEHYGWHTDIKPDNILVVGDTVNKSAKFKLADLGFAKVIRKADHRGQGVPKTRLWGGTVTYGAPEYQGRSQSRVSQAIDIWSLGCVFSIAATWVVLDHSGVEIFHRVRQMALRDIARRERTNARLEEEGKSDYGESNGDEFHDGQEALYVVTAWHDYIRSLPKTDKITAKVLDLVDESMLRGVADDRIDARRLCSELKEILTAGEPPPKNQVPASIVNYLKEIDKDATKQIAKMRHSNTAGMRGTMPIDPSVSEDLRAEPARRLLKTTHRQSVWREYKAHRESDVTAGASSPPASRPGTGPHTRSDGYHGRSHSHETVSTTPTRRTHSRKSNHNPPLNVFQARDAIERRESAKSKHDGDKKKSFSLPIPGRRGTHSKNTKIQKDALLTEYFKNRDIMFLVDNAISMVDHWYEVTYLLETLVRKARGQDPDGMDLHFTNGSLNLEGIDNAPAFVDKMREARPQQAVLTDMVKSLSEILNHYLMQVEREKRNPRFVAKDVTLVVLTDGLWGGNKKKEAVRDKIKEFLERLAHLGRNFKHRPFSIEFVQLGSDEEANARLRFLDRFLKIEQRHNPEKAAIYKDMIDMEPSWGDINKMLLGSFVEVYDEEDESESEEDEGDTKSLVHSPSDVSAGSTAPRETSPDVIGAQIQLGRMQYQDREAF